MTIVSFNFYFNFSFYFFFNFSYLPFLLHVYLPLSLIKQKEQPVLSGTCYSRRCEGDGCCTLYQRWGAGVMVWFLLPCGIGVCATTVARCVWSLHPCGGIIRVRFYGYHLSVGTSASAPRVSFCCCKGSELIRDSGTFGAFFFRCGQSGGGKRMKLPHR